MDRFAAMTAFTKVVELDGFARAADRLDLSVSAVSRQVSELERRLGTRLLNRTTRRLSLTESGRLFHERCVQLLGDLEEAEQSVTAETVTPRGTLRLTVPITFGSRYLAPAIAQFLARFPEMRFDVELSDHAVDLVDEGFDLALRVGEIGSQSLIGRRIGTTHLVCCAAPAYLARHGRPRTPADLARHVCLTYEYSALRNVWRFRDRKGADHDVRVTGPVHANNGRFLEALAVEGVGVACEPDFILGPSLQAGRLTPLLTGFEAPAAAMYLVYPSRRHLSAKVKSFVDFMAARFMDAPWRMPSARAAKKPAG